MRYRLDNATGDAKAYLDNPFFKREVNAMSTLVKRLEDGDAEALWALADIRAVTAEGNNFVQRLMRYISYEAKLDLTDLSAMNRYYAYAGRKIPNNGKGMVAQLSDELPIPPAPKPVGLVSIAPRDPDLVFFKRTSDGEWVKRKTPLKPKRNVYARVPKSKPTIPVAKNKKILNNVIDETTSVYKAGGGKSDVSGVFSAKSGKPIVPPKKGVAGKSSSTLTNDELEKIRSNPSAVLVRVASTENSFSLQDILSNIRNDFESMVLNGGLRKQPTIYLAKVTKNLEGFADSLADEDVAFFVQNLTSRMSEVFSKYFSMPTTSRVSTANYTAGSTHMQMLALERAGLIDYQALKLSAGAERTMKALGNSYRFMEQELDDVVDELMGQFKGSTIVTPTMQKRAVQPIAQ